MQSILTLIFMTMKNFYFATFFSFMGIIGQLTAQNVNIPDSNLKNSLLNYSNPVIDTNQDGEIQNSEAVVITGLTLVNKNIGDLTGIEAFINLQYLNLGINNINSINFSSAILTHLVLNNNNFQSIDLSQFPNLEIFNINNNSVQSIDLTSVPQLKSLSISFNNLNSIDVSTNINLEDLSIRENNLQVLDVGQNIDLEQLKAGSNNLNTIDLSQNQVLAAVSLQNNNFTSLDFSNNSELFQIYIGRNTSLNSLNISSNLKLEEFIIYGQTGLNNLDLSANTNLKMVVIESLAQNGLDLSNNTELVNLIMKDTDITQLDLSSNSDLVRLELESNQALTHINLKNGNNSSIDGSTYNLTLEYYQNTTPSVSYPITKEVVITDCPNLVGICVDDINYAIANFTQVEPPVTYTVNCSFGYEKSNLETQLTIYPNPTEDILFIQFKNGTELKGVSVYNLQGRKLLKIEGNKKTIDLEQLNAGIYLLKIKTNEGIIHYKLIKK